MTYRIITHGGCTDGFCSAFVFKKYIAPILGITISEILGAQPYNVQTGKFDFLPEDIVLDLPKPNTPVFFWCDHHATAKPDTLEKNQHWELTPSCTGLLFDIAKSMGASIPESTQAFRKAMDKIDSADYTPEEIKACYYPLENYQDLTVLQKLHTIGALFHTKDMYLNDMLFGTMLMQDLAETPVDAFDNFHPLLFHQAQLAGHADWRNDIDTFVEIQGKVVVQDYRKAKKVHGHYDRFYIYLKHPKATYGVTLKKVDDAQMRVGIGSNIFHKDWCTVDIGKLCKEVGKKFGEGSGGGHFGVGGATIFEDQADAALTFMVETLNT